MLRPHSLTSFLAPSSTSPSPQQHSPPQPTPTTHTTQQYLRNPQRVSHVALALCFKTRISARLGGAPPLPTHE